MYFGLLTKARSLPVAELSVPKPEILTASSPCTLAPRNSAICLRLYDWDIKLSKSQIIRVLAEI